MRIFIRQLKNCNFIVYSNASDFNHLLQTFIKSIDDPDKFLSIAFIFQLKKYHTFDALDKNAALINNLTTVN